MKPVIVFDLNETLLDLSSIEPVLARLVPVADGPALRRQWFAQLVELFLTLTIVGDYRALATLAEEALQMIAARAGRSVDSAGVDEFRQALGALRAHPDVLPGIDALTRAGFTVATLTNSSAASARKLLDRNRLLGSFTHVLSADEIRRFKPASECYRYAARVLGIDTSGMMLVAAHGWDITGAAAAGCQTAFIARPDKVPGPHGPAPELEASSVLELSSRLAAQFG